MRPFNTFIISIAVLANETRASVPRQRRSKGRRRQLEPLKSTKLDHSIRDRWIDIISLSYDESNAIRLENRREEDFYYSSELLAEKLLTGVVKDDANFLARARKKKSTDQLVSKIWDTIALGSTGILALFPLTMLFLEVVPPSTLSSVGALFTGMYTSINSSITPYLIPTINTIQTSVRDGMIQTQSIIHSLPYLLRHIRRIKLVPLLIKVIRKCIILEAWRHVWVRVYKISKRVLRGASIGGAKAYTKFVPAWIRRGVKNMFQSMVQAQVHGVVGTAVGGGFGGITFESLSWPTFGSSSAADVMAGDISVVEEAVGSVNDIPIDEALEGALESTVDASIDVLAPAVVSAVETAVESIDDVVDSAISDVAAAVSESLNSAVGSLVEENGVD
jgi:hypothetical protein